MPHKRDSPGAGLATTLAVSGSILKRHKLSESVSRRQTRSPDLEGHGDREHRHTALSRDEGSLIHLMVKLDGSDWARRAHAMLISSNTLIACACALASVVNVLVLNALLSTRSQARQVRVEPSHAHHSFIGTDFPLYMLPDLKTVALDVEDSVHYDFGAFGDWARYLATHRPYKPGPRYQAFLWSMGHGTHCLSRLHRALLPSLAPEKINIWHSQHCLNYIRQIILCNADTTLEPSDAFESGISGTHVCRDWTQVIDHAGEVNEDWRVANPFAEHS